MSVLPEPDDTWEVTVSSVAGWIDLPPDQRPRLIDCREAEELAICQLPGHEWFPLGTIPFRVEALGDTGHGVVIYCHHGVRSLQAASFLRAQGVERTFSMAGGIDDWSRLIDPSVPRY